MKAFPVVLGLALALGACAKPEDQVKNSIRETLSNQTTVDQVEMNTSADGNMTGYALTHEPDGRKGRMKCAAHPEGGNYSWKCTPEIDAETERQMQDVIRTELAKQGEVTEVVMKRKDDDDHMAGTAGVRAPDGSDFHFACTAERSKDAKFLWKCDPADEGDK